MADFVLVIFSCSKNKIYLNNDVTFYNKDYNVHNTAINHIEEQTNITHYNFRVSVHYLYIILDRLTLRF